MHNVKRLVFVVLDVIKHFAYIGEYTIQLFTVLFHKLLFNGVVKKAQ